MLENPEIKEYSFKIILLGQSGVGKTSILRKYVYKEFEYKYLCTLGVDYCLKKNEILGERVNLKIWDTAGQEKFRTVNKSYYLGSDACFIVFDLTSYNSFKDLDGWYDDFCQNSEEHAKNNIVVLGNKCDSDIKEIKKEEIDEFIEKKNLKYFETSAKEGINIDECFNYIMEKLITQYKNKNKHSQNPPVQKINLEKDIASKEINNNENNKCC